MTMAQNNRDNRFDSNGENGRESFHEHDERMRAFRRSHGSDLKVKISRRDLINMMWPLLVADTRKETGGSRLLNGITDWPDLIPIWRIAAHKFSQN